MTHFDIVSTLICSKHLFSIQAHQFHRSILTLGVDPGLRPALQARGHHGPLLLPPVQLGPRAAGRGGRGDQGEDDDDDSDYKEDDNNDDGDDDDDPGLPRL